MGAHQKLVHPDKKTDKKLKKDFAFIQYVDSLWVNCNSLRYKKVLFGFFLTPALMVGNKIIFYGIKLGMGQTIKMSAGIGLGGIVGAAITSSALSDSYFCYYIDSDSKNVGRIKKEDMIVILSDKPSLKKRYESDKNAKDSGTILEYLRELLAQ